MLTGGCLHKQNNNQKKKKKEWRDHQKYNLIASPISSLTEESKKAICESPYSGNNEAICIRLNRYKLWTMGRILATTTESTRELPKQAGNRWNSKNFIKEENHIKWYLCFNGLTLRPLHSLHCTQQLHLMKKTAASSLRSHRSGPSIKVVGNCEGKSQNWGSNRGRKSAYTSHKS